MTHNKILTIATLAGLILSAPSCSLLRKSSSSSSSTSTSTSTSTSKKSTAVYDDVEPETPTISPSSTPTEVAVNLDLIGGEWTVFTVKGKRISGESRPTLNFNLEDKRLYGNNGCNIVNGDFAVSAPNNLSITNVISTRMSCPDAQYENDINTAINTAKYFNVTHQGHEYYLEISNDQHRQTMTLRKHNMDFINGSWAIIEIEGETIDNPDVQMVIDIPELKIHGHTGCNILNGDLLIDPDKSYSIQFSNIATTKMMCSEVEAKIETAFLVALEKVEYAHKGKNSTIIFSNKNNEPIVILKKIDDSDNL